MANVLEKKEKNLSSVVSEFLDSNKFFEGFPSDIFGGRFPFLRQDPLQIPAVNIVENTNHYSFEMLLPGFTKDAIKVNVENGILNITARREEEKKDEGKNYMKREFTQSSFARSFRLPENSLADKLEAKYENGILKLNLPKKEVTVEQPGREIKVM